MPILRRKHDHVKVYRPNHTRYATVRDADLSVIGEKALAAFRAEFREDPAQEDVVIEIVGVTGGYEATVFEVIDRMIDSPPGVTDTWTRAF